MNTPSPRAPRPEDDSRAWLSALADGQADAAQPGCEAWRDDAGARETWHVYHLIGDVMRSDELAARPARDAAFLAALRTKLEVEPVVLAPAPVAAATPVRRVRARQRWLVPVAAAAGFVAVAGVLVVVRLQDPQSMGPQIAVGTQPAGPGLRLANTQSPAPTVMVIDGRLIRDAQLDRYLEAHRQAGTTVSRMPVPVAPLPAPVTR